VSDEWHKCADVSAPEGVTVMTKIDDPRGTRNVQPLTRQGNLWWTNVHDCPCGVCKSSSSMYVYYTPTHWRELTDAD